MSTNYNLKKGLLVPPPSVHNILLRALFSSDQMKITRSDQSFKGANKWVFFLLLPKPREQTNQKKEDEAIGHSFSTLTPPSPFFSLSPLTQTRVLSLWPFRNLNLRSGNVKNCHKMAAVTKSGVFCLIERPQMAHMLATKKTCGVVFGDLRQKCKTK